MPVLTVSPPTTSPLILTDRSCLTRFGVKGANAADWLASQGLTIPDRPNSWCPLPNPSAGIIARLGLSEFLIEDSLSSRLAPQLAMACQTPPAKVYPVLRQDLAIALSGPATHELLQQTCNLNFRALILADRPILLTSLIGVVVTLLPGEHNGHPFYRLWCDGTFGNYLWQTLVAIATEFGGTITNVEL
ncbi:MAG: methylglutamate dehydrogenase [Scytolyngbya sp. HA4215-MV1]|jgi:sarcosine oxidase subunit gamma|nr:methylglutamate dehydrogenase [Scytolyngbya sp. HA4215-MV1]